MVAYTGGRLHVDQFPHPAVVDLSTLQADRANYPIHLDHVRSQRVGHTTAITVDQRITAQGLVSGANEHASEVVTSGDNGFPWQASIGVRFDNSNVSFVRAGQSVIVNGKSVSGPVYVVKNGTLSEISFVSVGGDEDGATARVAASATAPKGAAMKTFEKWLMAQGINPRTLKGALRQTLLAAFKAEQEAGEVEAAENDDDTMEAAEDEESLDAEEGEEESTGATTASGRVASTLNANQLTAGQNRQVAANLNRINQIQQLCAKYGNPTMKINNQEVSIESHAIASSWSAKDTELELLRQSRGSASIQAHSHSGMCTLEAMQGAVILAGGVPLDSEIFGTMQAQAMGIPNWTSRGINDDRRQRIMEAAHRFSEMHALEICREAVRLDGRMVPSGRRNLIEAAFSGSNLLNIWTTNINARLLLKFTETSDTTRGWCRDRDVSDFRLNENIRVEKGGKMEKHSRGGSATHHSGSDTKESYRIARYSRQFFRDEMDVIDDRLMAGQDVIDEMALAAARLRPDLVYAILMGNPDMADGTALFHTDRNNLDETSAAMDETHLAEAITRMWLMQENGVNLNLMPTHLVTAATLNFKARQVLQSAETRQPAATGGPTMNALQNAVANLVSDSRIDNGVVDPDSGTTIAGDPTAFFVISNQAPTIEVGYLQGTGRAPSVTTWRKNGEDGIWGVGAAVKMDIGALAVAFQTMQKLTD